MQLVSSGTPAFASTPPCLPSIACSAEGIPDDVLVADSLESAVAVLRADESIDKTFVIGGAAAFAEVFSSGAGASGAASFVCDKIYLTKVFSAFDCDVRIPAVDEAVYGLAAFEVSVTLCYVMQAARLCCAGYLLDWCSGNQHRCGVMG